MRKALEQKLEGATVLPGPDGFGQSRHVRSELSIDAGPRSPMIVEIVDREERINSFLPYLQDMVDSGLMTLEKVRAIRYRREQAARQ